MINITNTNEEGPDKEMFEIKQLNSFQVMNENLNPYKESNEYGNFNSSNSKSKDQFSKNQSIPDIVYEEGKLI